MKWLSIFSDIPREEVLPNGRQRPKVSVLDTRCVEIVISDIIFPLAIKICKTDCGFIKFSIRHLSFCYLTFALFLKLWQQIFLRLRKKSFQKTLIRKGLQNFPDSHLVSRQKIPLRHHFGAGLLEAFEDDRPGCRTQTASPSADAESIAPAGCPPPQFSHDASRTLIASSPY